MPDKFKNWYRWGKDLGPRGRKLWAEFIKHKYVVFRKYGIHCLVLKGKDWIDKQPSNLGQLNNILKEFRKGNGIWSKKNIWSKYRGVPGFYTLNLGIACGPSGFIVLDVDTKKGRVGKEQLAKLVAAAGMRKKDISHTMYVSSGSGNGAGHYYFRIGKLNIQKLVHNWKPLGLDILYGGKKYDKYKWFEEITSPYSIHPTGGLYWIADPTTGKPLPFNSKTFYLDRIAPFPVRIYQAIARKNKK